MVQAAVQTFSFRNLGLSRMVVVELSKESIVICVSGITQKFFIAILTIRVEFLYREAISFVREHTDKHVFLNRVLFYDEILAIAGRTILR